VAAAVEICDCPQSIYVELLHKRVKLTTDVTFERMRHGGPGRINFGLQLQSPDCSLN